MAIPLTANAGIKESAEKAGLNPDEFAKWLHKEDGSLAISFENGKKYKIPNVVIAYWAGDNVLWKGFSKYWVDWQGNIAYLQSLGFKVEEYGSEGIEGDYQAKLLLALACSTLHGTYFWGHGTKRKLGTKDPREQTLLIFNTYKPQCKTGFAFVFACDSNSGEKAFNVALWHGYSGVLIPANPWGTLLPGINSSEWRLNTYIKPGDQGTSK